MTVRTPQSELRPADVLNISRADAARYGLAEGCIASVRGRYGTARLPVHISDQVRAGEVFATFHATTSFLNYVTSPVRDAFTETPEYKVTAVHVERAS